GGGAYARPTYLQISDEREVVRLGPDMIRVLRRPREYYQRRQLFPEADRVKFAESHQATPFGPPPEVSAGPVPIPRAKSIALEGPLGKIVLNRIGDLSQPAEVAIDTALLAERWEVVVPPPSLWAW